MAEEFKNARGALGVAAAQIYQVPAGKRAVIAHLQVANVGVAEAEFTCYWQDSSAGNAQTHLAKGTVVPVAAAYGPMEGSLVLEAGDSLWGQASLAATLELGLAVVLDDA